VVLPREIYAAAEGTEGEILQRFITESGLLNDCLVDAKFDTRVGMIDGYSCNVESLYGDNFALLGNAGEFLDPVFSSGVTIALKSASLAAEVVHRQLQGLKPDWQTEYADPLMQGVNTFRAFVEGWYDGRLQDVIFAADKSEQIKAMISSILAGYAWDEENPYVRDPSRLTTLAELCRK
jgi:flavin-dependent dehydrogenase